MRTAALTLPVALLVSCLVTVLAAHGEEAHVHHGHDSKHSSNDGTPACRYAPTSPWSTCDLEKGTKSKEMTLTHGNPQLCPLTKVKTKVCRRLKKRRKNKRKGCKYARSSWGECDSKTGMQEMVLMLRKGNPGLCSLSRTKTRSCQPAHAPASQPVHAPASQPAHMPVSQPSQPDSPEGLGAPQDLTVLPPDPSDPHSLLLSWQPPRLPHPHLAGYQLEYTTRDNPRPEQWAGLQVPSDHLSVRVEGLTPHTPYLFRIAALGPHGPGRKSPVVAFTTPSV